MNKIAITLVVLALILLTVSFINKDFLRPLLITAVVGAIYSCIGYFMAVRSKKRTNWRKP